MKWIDNDRHPDEDFCHSKPAVKPGEDVAFRNVDRAGLLIVLAAFFSFLFSPIAVAAETPEALLAAGRVDQALQTLEQQIRTAPTAEAYNLLCRAHFEFEDWD